MSRTKKPPEHVNHERWLVSYADFITLLFAFFVVMYASSQVDHQKAGKMSHAIETAFKQLGVFEVSSSTPPINDSGGPSPTPSVSDRNTDAPATDLVSELKQALDKELASNTVTVESTPEGIVISLREVGVFPTASTELKPAAKDVLRRIARSLTKNGMAVRIEGHTDDIPIHNAEFASNWHLASARAVTVLEQLESFGVPSTRLSAAAYAEFRPARPNDSDVHRALNRRVDIVVLRRFRSVDLYTPMADSRNKPTTAGKP